eukprot:6183138-Pleurochrysis_carterae.AAC.7
MQSDSKPMRDRKAAMPSARAIGPENSRRARCDEWVGSCRSRATGGEDVPAGGLCRHRFGRGSCRAPREASFAEVGLGSGDDAKMRRSEGTQMW